VESDPPKRKVTTQGKTSNKKKQHCDISDAGLDAQLKQVSAFNANDSLLHAATKDNETKKVTKEYFTMPVLGKKSSVWWEGFTQFIPSKLPKLFTEYVMCLSCSKLANPESGLVKIGIFQSTSNLRAHKKFNHPKEYKVIANSNNLKTPQSPVPMTSIKNMSGFVTKLKTKCAKLIYRTAAAMLAIEEGIPFHTFEQPSFRRLFTPLNHESNKIVKLQRHQVKDAVLKMGSYAMKATKQEIHNHWTTNHWTGQDKATYTTVTAHWINDKTWMLKSAVLDFKIFEGSTIGERIYEDVVVVLQKYQVETEDTIVFDTIGITDTTGNMG
jgi:hypothetical protein